MNRAFKAGQTSRLNIDQPYVHQQPFGREENKNMEFTHPLAMHDGLGENMLTLNHFQRQNLSHTLSTPENPDIC